MEEKELKALVSLLDDEDQQIITHVETKILSLGKTIIPLLEAQWENSFSPNTQSRIENLIHTLQFRLLQDRLIHWKESESEDLLKGMWVIATYLYPDLEFEKLQKEIEQIYYEAWLEQKDNMHPYDQVRSLNNVLFHKLKFRGNTRNFHAPANSLINNVLESKKGNPISLSIIYSLVAQKMNIPIYGVNLPNMFIVTYKSNAVTQFYINPFNKGIIFTREDIDSYIGELNLSPAKEFYEPCSNIDIIKRVLRNLANAFEQLGDHSKNNEVKMLLQSISPVGEW
ncbi:MAG: transglutaminase-like domain-containing protein [Cyclobacteriaceae bacterium]|nr:transglutaminase-like domain-containing protein [Cyclobacteriaceae bacterium]